MGLMAGVWLVYLAQLVCFNATACSPVCLGASFLSNQEWDCCGGVTWRIPLAVAMNVWNRLLLGLALVAPVLAQGPRPGVTTDWAKVEARIAWHGTWTGALAAAEASQRPILLVFAAPHCGSVPGMW